MHKKLDIAKKVKRLLEEKREDTPIFKPIDAEEIGETREEPPIRVTKPPISAGPLSIKDLAIPASAYELFSIETTFDSTGTEKVTQLLSLREDPKVKLKWTVYRDPYVEEFDWLKRQGLVKITDDPLIYGRELDEGTLVASHMGDYTFSMASHDLNVDRMGEIFTPLLEYVTEKIGGEKSDVLYPDRDRDELLNIKTAEVKDLKRRMGELKKTREKSDVLYQDRDELLNIKTAEVEDLKRQVEELKRAHKKGDVAYQERDELLSARTAEVEDFKRQIEELKRAHKKSDVTYQERDEALSAKTAEVGDLKRQVEELKKTREKSNTLYQERDEALSAKTVEIEDLKSQIEELKSQVEELKKTREKSDVTYQERDELLSAKTAEVEDLKRQIGDLKKTREKSYVAYQERDEALSARTAEIKDLKRRNEKLERQVKELTTVRKEREETPKAPSKEGKKGILIIEKRSAEKMLDGLLSGRVDVAIAQRRVRERIYRKKIEDIDRRIRELEEG